MAQYKKIVDVWGDKLDIEWTGSVWVSPSNGQQHGRAESAMRSELEAYFIATGEHPDDLEELIDQYIGKMQYA